MTTQTQKGAFKLADSGDANYVAIQAPSTQAAPVTYTLPPVPASTGLTLTSSTAGVMTWAAASGLALAAVGASPNANGALLTANTLVLEPASASFPGAMTTGAQTLAGTKTFNNPVTLKDTGDANVIALQAPSTQAGNTTYTLPTAPASTGLSLTSTTGGVMSWSSIVGSGPNAINSISSTPGDGSTVNYTVGGITPTWITVFAIGGQSSTDINSYTGQSYGWCNTTVGQGCTVLFAHIGTGVFRRGLSGTVLYVDSDVSSPVTGTVTSLSANNVSILWSNPSSRAVTFIIHAHA